MLADETLSVEDTLRDGEGNAEWEWEKQQEESRDDRQGDGGELRRRRLGLCFLEWMPKGSWR